MQGITTETLTIAGAEHNEIALSVHRPADVPGPVPCVIHLHGGGMVFLTARDPCFVRWREELAATGVTVVGVEFRNAAGKLGCHPFPAGLDDCASAVRWAASHLPPHVISVNELDPLHDKGLAYYRRARDAGVSVVGRVVAGTSHGAEVLLAGATPEVRAATLRDISGFARWLAMDSGRSPARPVP